MKKKTFEEIARLWREDKKNYVKKSTLASYSLILSHYLLPHFGEKYSISEKMVQKWVLEQLDAGMSRKTIKDILVVFRMVLHFGSKYSYMKEHRIDIHFPTEKVKPEVEVLSRSQQRVLMSYLYQNMDFRNLGVCICLSTGLRIGEICALKWNDIDLDNGIICVNKTIQRIYMVEEQRRYTELLIDTPKSKNSKRQIPLTRDLQQILLSLKQNVSEGNYILSNSPVPYEPRTYRRYYKSLLHNLGLPEIKFHGLRHSFATRCIEADCDYKTVSVLLGHSNISTTLNLYVHPNLEQKQKCIDMMFNSL